MKSLIIGGGGTKIVGQFPIASEVYHTILPEIIDGTSAGAILAFTIPCTNKHTIKTSLLSLKPCDFWKINPVSKSNNFSLLGIVRALKSEPSLGDMSNLKKYLMKIVTEKSFDENIKYNEDLHKVYVSTVCFNTGHRAHINLKDCSYLEALDWVVTSASIPVYAQNYEYNKYHYYDGGVRSHVGGPWVLETHGKELTDIITVYSRPEDYNIIDQKWYPENVLKVLERTIEIMNMEISKRDQADEIKMCKDLGVNLTQLFLPKVLNSTYDTDRTRLTQLYNKGLNIAREWKLQNINQL